MTLNLTTINLIGTNINLKEGSVNMENPNFSAKPTFANAHSPIGMTECNQVARAVTQSPDELISYLNELQSAGNMTSNERTLAIILRGVLIKLAAEPN